VKEYLELVKLVQLVRPQKEPEHLEVEFSLLATQIFTLQMLQSVLLLLRRLGMHLKILDLVE
jgi:hypothetical protein